MDKARERQLWLRVQGTVSRPALSLSSMLKGFLQVLGSRSSYQRLFHTELDHALTAD